MALEITDSNYKEVLAEGKPVVVDFWAPWCGPCKMMHPVLEELAGKVGDKARIVKIDIDKNEKLAAIYNVRSVPTFMIFVKGELKWRASGMRSEQELEQELAKFY